MTDIIDAIMTRQVYKARASESSAEVLRDLVRVGISGCPVVTHDDTCVGVVSWRDLVQCDDEDPISEFMSTPAIVVLRRTTLAEAAKVMTDQKVHRLVVTEESKVVGIVSAADIVRAISPWPRLVAAAAAG